MISCSSIVVEKRFMARSIHHRELSKKCPKLLPSPGFEPRPFDISEQLLSIQRYGRYAIDKVCLPSGNVPVHNIARIGVSSRGTSTHFRHHRPHIGTESFDTRRQRSRAPQTLEISRGIRYSTLEFPSSIND